MFPTEASSGAQTVEGVPLRASARFSLKRGKSAGLEDEQNRSQVCVNSDGAKRFRLRLNIHSGDRGGVDANWDLQLFG